MNGNSKTVFISLFAANFMKSIFALLTISIAIAGCTDSEHSQMGSNISKSPEFEIYVLDSFADKADRVDGSYVYTTYKIPTQTKKLVDYTIEIYPKILAPCSQPLTGVSNTINLQDGLWGKVDAFDAYLADFPPDTQPRCRPPILEWSASEDRGIQRMSNDAAYAFCAEKNGKTVLICIEQQTDNPALAEEIFKTFRWTQ